MLNQNNMCQNEPLPDPHSLDLELDHIVHLAHGLRARQKILHLCTHNIFKGSGQGRMDNGMHNQSCIGSIVYRHKDLNPKFGQAHTHQHQYFAKNLALDSGVDRHWFLQCSLHPICD